MMLPAVPILTYHSIDDSGSPISIRPDAFRYHMASLRDGGWRALQPTELLQGHVLGGWPDRTLAITFDDGFANFADHAAPILDAYAFPAILFVVAGHVGGRNDWPSQPRWVPRLPLLDWPELRALARAGITLGAHSWTHRPLVGLPEGEVEAEVMRTKRALEDHVGRQVDWFAYPFGSMNAGVEAVVGRHFAAAVGTKLALATATSRSTALERIDMFYLRGARLTGALESRWLGPRLAIRRTIRTLQGKT